MSMEEKNENLPRDNAEGHKEDSITIIYGNTMMKQEAKGITLRVR